MKIFSIYDEKCKAHKYIHLLPFTGDALRSFQGAVNNPESDLSKFAKDYYLYELGEVDEQTGKITIPEHATELAWAELYRTLSEEAKDEQA